MSKGEGVGLVSLFEFFCTSYIFLWVSFSGGGLINDILLDAVSIKGALVFSVLLGIAGFYLLFFFCCYVVF